MPDNRVALVRLSSQNADNFERQSRRFWVGLILFFLIGSMTTWIYAAYLAISDPSMAVVPDYHQKAIHWDDELEVRRQSQMLGWTVHLSPPSQADSTRPMSQLQTWEIFLRDRDARPIERAVGTLQLYHHARAREIQTVSIHEKEPGTYSVTIELPRQGLWQFTLVLDRDADHFQWSQEREVKW